MTKLLNVVKPLVVFGLLFSATVLSADEFPYRAQVLRGGAAVFAGPGPHYYDTAELPAGAEVEVFEHNSSGYCAIRPPEGSFSWLPASALRITGERVAEVTRDAAPARVGSLLHERRDAVHVRLNLGERVQVLAERDIDGVRWVQIAPPSGEFRWIEQDRLAPIDRETTQPSAQQQSAPSWVRAAGHTEDQETKSAPLAPTAEAVDANAIQKPAPAPPTATLTGDFAQQLSALEVTLARQVAELPTLWRLDGLEQQAAQLMGVAQTEQERQAVRDYATRVDRFATIANQYKTQRGTAPRAVLTRPRIPSTPTPPTVVSEDGFDAVGTLRPVVSQRPGAPQYALVDTQGKIVSFLTAPTEMNLSSLLGARVGVLGSKGFMPEYQQPHLTAGRVTPLGGSLR